jgi:hypothetical protein
VTREEYLRDVEWELRDVPWKRRKQLVADLAAHLEETPPEELDSPAAYATALRESAGLPQKGGLLVFLRARRPRNLVIVALLLVLVATLATGLAWVESYQPLAMGNFAIDPPGSRSGPTGEQAVSFRDGKPFEVGFSVLNKGAFTVHISAGPRYLDADPFSVRLYVSGPLEHAHTIPGRLSPFHPFDLPPGQQRMLVLKGVFSHCHDWGGGSSFVFDWFPVTFSFLWHTETVRIPASSPFVIQIPAGRRCLR